MKKNKILSTTVLAVKKDNHVVLAGDGQVTFGNTILKHHASKIRKIYDNKVLTGFAGSTADAFTLFERFEGKLKEYHGNLLRAAVELAKDWRMDRNLRRLEAFLIVADRDKMLLISGTGDVVEPDSNAIAIGSGGPYAYAAARTLLDNTSMDLKEIAMKAMKIASEICVYTNSEITIEELM
jgi:ATP-dependent HslUV protease subunit HslV